MIISRNMRLSALAVGITLALANVGLAQGNARGGSSGSQPPPLATPPVSAVPPELAPAPEMQQEQAKMRNTDRQKQLVLDTEKLLALAHELKTDVDKSSKDTLSLDVIRKADEIEKLAHNVKEKMKGS